MIDLVDAKTEQLIWRGAAQSRLRVTTTPEDSEQRTREVVSKLLASYPPGGAAADKAGDEGSE